MCQSVPSVKSDKLGNIVDWTRWISQVLVIPLLIIMATAWWDHESRMDKHAEALSSIVGNRFTSADGLEVWKEIARLQQEIAAMAAAQKMHNDLSDGWIDVIREHERRIGKLEN